MVQYLIIVRKIKFWILIFSIVCMFIYQHYQTDNICIKYPNISYTHIIVGAGTSGCILATRLSEDTNNKVLLIEAGGHFSFFAKVPMLNIFLQKSVNDWLYESNPQKWSSKGFFEKKQALAQGKGLGGSGEMNFMVYDTTDVNILNIWDSIGAHDLKRYFVNTWSSMKSSICFMKRTDYFNHMFFKNKNTDNEYFMKESNMHHTYLQKSNSDLTKILYESIKELNKTHSKFTPCLSTIHRGQRWSTYNSHLLFAAKRNNLHILCNTQAIQIIIENRKAIAVQTRTNEREAKIYSQSEIILTAGAINTPKLLLLSGIGNKTKLQKLDVPVVIDAPGVGINMHDHFYVPLYISIQQPLTLTLKKLLNIQTFYDYIFHKKGLLSESPLPGVLKFESDINLIIFNMGSIDKTLFCSIANYMPQTFQNIFPLHNNISQEGFIILAGCAYPRSRGYVTLQSKNSFYKPIIDPQYLSDTHDIDSTIKAIKFVQMVVNTTVFQNIGAKMHWPKFKECKKYEFNSNQNSYLKCIVETTAITLHHQAGTCKMGSQKDILSVTDYNFRVKRINGLRIVDASILPSPILFPYATLITLAEYAAKIIKHN